MAYMAIKSGIKWLVAALSILVIVPLAVKGIDSDYSSNKGEGDELSIVSSQFSAWDGSHKWLKSAVKENLHNPSSFEHVETKHWVKDGYLYVTMRYRGENGFGAIRLDEISVKMNLDGSDPQVFEAP